MNLRSNTILLLVTLCTFVSAASYDAFGQSTSQNYPTPVRTNEINGVIKARDIGDSRLTSYYYQFDGSQGDIFINLVTRNFTGDIDIFTMNGLRSLTKIVVYADFAETETGRVIYLRKPEQLILRVHGRTPGDDPATFRIKFAGSFVASSMPDPPAGPELPTVTAQNESGIQVNSVGTIVAVIPKATPSPEPVEIVNDPAEPVTTEAKGLPAKTEALKTDNLAEAKEDEVKQPETPAEKEPTKRVEVVVTDELAEKAEATPTAPARPPARGRRRTPPRSTPPADNPETVTETNPPAANPSTRTSRRRSRTPPTEPPPAAPDPLAHINLVILFKDGAKIERPLTEIQRFTVDRGVLTVVAKDGSIGRYSMIDVARVTIE